MLYIYTEKKSGKADAPALVAQCHHEFSAPETACLSGLN